MTMTITSGERKKTACVTGANGFLATALVKLLLQCGYTVNATVRNTTKENKVAHLLALKSLGELKIFNADLGVEGSFDEAILGCDYAFLVASPVAFDDKDPENELIKPAVEGTLNVLRSCARAKTARVVLTSSAAAVSANRLEGPGLVLDEGSWTDVEFLYANKPPTWGYLAAKTLAEKAAWQFAADNNLDLVAVNPTLIIGPSLTQETPFSIKLALALITGEELPTLAIKIMEKVSGSISVVHLEDVCRAQLFLAEAPAAKGRYIVSAVDSGLWALSAFLSSRYPQHKITTSLSDVPERPRVRFSTGKLRKEGFKFKHEKLEDFYDLAVEMGHVAGLLPVPTNQ
ncbi:NAD(P)-binding Rossmann-fold superfamily protein [Wolffia australiana]